MGVVYWLNHRSRWWLKPMRSSRKCRRSRALLLCRGSERCTLMTDDIHVESDMWCSLDEDSLVVPFWLKAVNFSKSHHRGGCLREWWSGRVRILRKRPLFCRCSPLSGPSLSLWALSVECGLRGRGQVKPRLGLPRLRPGNGWLWEPYVFWQSAGG